MAVAPREEPSTTYIDRAYEPSYFVDEADRPPLLVVLDLNQTLLVRDGRSQSESATPTARPFLSTVHDLETRCADRTVHAVSGEPDDVWASTIRADHLVQLAAAEVRRCPFCLL